MARDSAIHFSPPSVTDPVKVAFIKCGAGDCHASFDLDGLGLVIDFDQKKLSRWTGIINPMGDLVQSFIVDRVSTAPTQPASTPRY